MPLGVAVDANGNIYAANTYYADYCSQVQGNVTIYKRGSNGNVPPIGIIYDAGVNSIAVDSAGDVYTIGVDYEGRDSCPASIHVYAPSASGYQLVQDITGSNFAGGSDITVDSSKNIWVAQGSSLLMYAAGSNGNAAPSAVISGPNTDLSARSVALDASGNVYAGNVIDGSNMPGSVTVYPAGSNGNALPSQGIVGPKTKLTAPIGMVVR
jgi:hypothetical protein